MQPAETKKKSSPKGKAISGQNRTKKKGSGEYRQSGKRVRQSAFLAALKAQRYFNVRKACAEAKVSRSQYYEWLEKDARFQAIVEEIIEGRKDDCEEDLQKQSRCGDSKSTIFFLERKCRDRGYGKEADGNKLKVILKRALEGEITPLEAAYEVNMLGLPLPEVLKLQLNKPELPKPPEERPPLSPDELERKYQETLKQAEAQRDDFLPKRQEEVRQMKDEMKNLEQFGPNGSQVGVE